MHFIDAADKFIAKITGVTAGGEIRNNQSTSKKLRRKSGPMSSAYGIKC